MSDLISLLPPDAHKHYMNLRNVRDDHERKLHNQRLDEVKGMAAERHLFNSGWYLSRMSELKTEFIDALSYGEIEVVIETCTVYDIPLTRPLCTSLEEAAKNMLTGRYRQIIQTQGAGIGDFRVPASAIQQINARVQSRQFIIMPKIAVMIEAARVADERKRAEEMANKATKIPAYKPPKRYAVGTNVRVRNPGVDGVVTFMDEERTVMAEYWHTVMTKYGERREPGGNLELIEEPITHSKPAPSKLADNIHFHGDNSRLNVNSIDKSNNVASTASEAVFAALAEKAKSVQDAADRERIEAAIVEMQAAHQSGGFLAQYQHFMSVASDHITVFGPLLPVLAMLLSNLPS